MYTIYLWSKPRLIFVYNCGCTSRDHLIQDSSRLSIEISGVLSRKTRISARPQGLQTPMVVARPPPRCRARRRHGSGLPYFDLSLFIVFLFVFLLMFYLAYFLLVRFSCYLFIVFVSLYLLTLFDGLLNNISADRSIHIGLY